MTAGKKHIPDPYHTDLQKALESFRVLFEVLPGSGAFQEKRMVLAESSSSGPFLEALYAFLHLERCRENKEAQFHSERMTLDTVDALNMLGACCTRNSPDTLLDTALREALNRLNSEALRSMQDLKEAADPESFLNWTLRHAVQLARSLQAVFENCSVLQEAREKKKDPDHLGILTPGAAKLNLHTSIFLRSSLKVLAMELFKEQGRNDPFSAGRIFRCKGGKLLPAKGTPLPGMDEFFGYMEAKNIFREHFKAFQEGKHNIPLLLDGLPGLGKTKMTMAFALGMTDGILILPGPEELQNGLEELIGILARYPEHKFILFFDDVEPEKIDFYPFRTHVGGSFALPEHILVILASNYRFPPNVASRGRTFTFPMFDEIRCQEMIEDFLLSKGMKNVSNDLLSVIASDYVESYGQKLYDELSPRSLARYLTVYLQDREKRTSMVDFSRGEVITRPDPEAFYAQNLKLLRSLYGKEILEEIREQQLSGKG